MTGKQLGPLAAIAVGMSLVLAACGADPTATPTTAQTGTPLPQATPTSTPDEAARAEAEWDALIKAAQEEGELTMSFGGQASENFRPLVEFFEEKFGIKVVATTGSGSASANRVLAERAAGLYLVDVIYGGVTSSNTRLVPANALDPIAELFVHPEVTDKSLWFQGRYWYSDTAQKFVFTFAAAATPMNMSMRYNTDLVAQADIDAMNSVFDFLDPKWNGKIASLAPGAGGSGTWFEAYVHPDIGTEWIDGFFAPDLDVTFFSDVRLVVDGVAKGKFAMVIAGGSAGGTLDSLASLGAPTGELVKEFKEGGAIRGNQNQVMVPTNRPHPNAAKLWVNWFLAKEGQSLQMTAAVGIPGPTLREDLTDFGKTRVHDRREQGKSYYFFTADPVLVARRTEALDYVNTAYDALLEQRRAQP